MRTLAHVDRVSDVRLGSNALFDAWWYTFLAENNMEHSINPMGVSSPEQVRFMAALDANQIYVPCPDEVFNYLIDTYNKKPSPRVLRWYAGIWRITVNMINKEAKNKKQRIRMLYYCRNRFLNCLALGNILPWRMLKRMLATIANLNENKDPWKEEKATESVRLKQLMESEKWRDALDHLPQQSVPYTGVYGARRQLNMLELARLFYLAGQQNISMTSDLPAMCKQAQTLLPVIETLTSEAEGAPKTFLFVVDSDGNTLLAIEILKSLIRQGYRVILSLKDSPLFKAPVFWNVENDPVLKDALHDALFISDKAISKNALLASLDRNHFVAINDGSSELLNLYRTSATFARAWKECDAVIVQGWRQSNMLLASSTEFTRDIYCFWMDLQGETRMDHKPRAKNAARFGEADLIAQANRIIASMQQARTHGKSVMFYSCIIGSLPGEISTAIELADTFITHLRDKLDQVFIINPAEHFITGMDADDLMFMWERVQRSGLINTWRFQSVEDIEMSFALLGRKVPPVWTGKDSTYSTGCTKEMRIALDMQRHHREMQIIGPAVEKFFRRGEYELGKFHDVALG